MNRKVNLLRALVWFMLGADIFAIFGFVLDGELSNPAMPYFLALFGGLIVIDMELWKYQKKVDGE